MKKYLLFVSIWAISGGAFAGYYNPYQQTPPTPVYQQPVQQVYTYQPQQVPVYQSSQPVYHTRQVIPHSMSSVDQTKAYFSAKLKHINMETEAEWITKKSIDDSVMGGAFAFGISHKTPSGTLRAEVEYNINGATEKKEDVLVPAFDGIYEAEEHIEISTQALMLNGYYNFETGSKISPYIGAGIGFARIKGTLDWADIEVLNIKKTNFAWQAGLGVSYDITNNFAIDTGYRYMDYGDFEKDGVKADTSAHEFYTGVRVSF
ncbi:MAG: outer membrane beta-barrel protein [Alphaproteobacteria bacterium]|nr:outer membrane beta-barrel protein [Alphaproteobacteria bacterium]